MRRSGLRGRPLVVTDYGQDIALLNTPAKRRSTLALIVAALLLPFLVTDDLLVIGSLGMVAAVGAIGLNLVTGYAGQISLGHAFFLGVGAYTGAMLGGSGSANVIGLELPWWIWLPAAGLVAGAIGMLVGPLAVRLRGLYLAILTLGLVFLGLHIFREWRAATGGPGVGRRAARLEIFGFDVNAGGEILGLTLGREQSRFLFALVFLIVFGVLARNIARSGVGRAFAAVRDRDIAAAVIGVDLTRYKVLAFALSSFYAGVCGAVYFSMIGVVEPTRFSLLMSVQFLAMILVGGVATISGAIMGALFITALPRIAAEVAHLMPFISESAAGGGLLTVFQLEAILYGLLIIAFLVFEPRGLFGIWMRVRNYWKGWPFSY